MATRFKPSVASLNSVSPLLFRLNPMDVNPLLGVNTGSAYSDAGGYAYLENGKFWSQSSMAITGTRVPCTIGGCKLLFDPYNYAQVAPSTALVEELRRIVNICAQLGTNGPTADRPKWTKAAEVYGQILESWRQRLAAEILTPGAAPALPTGTSLPGGQLPSAAPQSELPPSDEPGGDKKFYEHPLFFPAVAFSLVGITAAAIIFIKSRNK